MSPALPEPLLKPPRLASEVAGGLEIPVRAIFEDKASLAALRRLLA